MTNLIVFGSDHAGTCLKETLKTFVTSKGYEVLDMGTHTQEPSQYPLFAQQVAQKLLQNKAFLGVLICGTGIGMSISANRFKGIQAALCHTEYEARAARNHNHANILCLGARVIGEQQAISCLQAFMEEEPSTDPRHIERVHMMNSNFQE
jgi:ribose 5-phosphate isomerase B